MSVFYLLIVSTLFVVSHSCKCRPPNITVSYCRADVVAHVKVLNTTTDGDLSYGVETIKVYRKTEKYDAVKEKYILNTPPIGGGCGVKIDVKSKDNEWLVFGLVGHKQIFINSCSANSLWSKDLKTQLEGSLTKLNCTSVALEGHHARNSTRNHTDTTTTHKPKLFNL